MFTIGITRVNSPFIDDKILDNVAVEAQAGSIALSHSYTNTVNRLETSEVVFPPTEN